MRKFAKFSVISRKWCDSVATVDDILFCKWTVFRQVCVICGKKTRRELHTWESLGAYGLSTAHYFCNNCVISKAQAANSVITLKRVVADYANFILKKELFTAKNIAFRKSDILSVEGAAYDHSILHFNAGTLYAGHDSVRVTERKNVVMRLLGETIAPPQGQN